MRSERKSPSHAAPSVKFKRKSSAGSAGRRPLFALLGVVGALALAGVFLAAGTLSRGGLASLLQPVHYHVAQDIPTSFGIVAVEHAEILNGLTAKDLAGVTHGIQNLVLDDQVQVQAAVTMTNLTKRVVAYSPSQFRLIAGDAPPVDAVTANMQSGRLQPDANIDATLSFVVSRNGAQLWVEFRDPGRSTPILIDLGTLDQSPQGGQDEHQH